MRKTPLPAAWLLRWLGRDSGDGPLIGDLLEEYGDGKSAVWLWRQMLTAILVKARRFRLRQVVQTHYGEVLVFAGCSTIASAFTIVMTLAILLVPPANRALVAHSNSEIRASVAMFIIFMVGFYFLASLILLIWRKFHSAMKMFLAAAGTAAAYGAAVTIISLAEPPTIVTIGDSYCHETQCIGIRKVNATPSAQQLRVEVDIVMFTNAKLVRSTPRPFPWRATTTSLHLVDDSGRGSPLVYDSLQTARDVTFSPGQSVHTSLNFIAPKGARQLFLTDAPWAFEDPWWVKLYLGDDFSLLHRHWLLRVT